MNNKITPLEVGRRIETRRRDLRIKQETLATMLGMSQSNFSRIERGEYLPDKYQAEKLAAALQCDEDFLLR